MSQGVRRVGRIAGIVLLVVFLTFTLNGSRDETETRSEGRIGAWFSPWLRWSSTERREKTPDGGLSVSTSDDWAIDWLSWSWVALIGGIALLRVCRNRPTPPS
jgi:hypothetical protein